MKLRMAEHGRLLVTKEMGRKLATGLRRGGRAELDFEGVEVASPSFLGALMRTAVAKGVTVSAINTTPHIEESLARVVRSIEGQANGS
jgi:hypothetical protein